MNNTAQRIANATHNAKFNDIKFIHFKTPYSPYGGLTVAYKSNGKNSATIEIATAVCADTDQFNKSVGRTMATERFVAGFTIFVPINRNLQANTVTALQSMFMHCV